MLEEALEHLVKGIVDNPDEVQVASRNLRRGRVLEVRVHPDDLGKVIGRNGRTAAPCAPSWAPSAAAVSASTSSTWTRSAEPHDAAPARAGRALPSRPVCVRAVLDAPVRTGPVRERTAGRSAQQRQSADREPRAQCSW